MYRAPSGGLPHGLAVVRRRRRFGARVVLGLEGSSALNRIERSCGGRCSDESARLIYVPVRCLGFGSGCPPKVSHVS